MGIGARYWEAERPVLLAPMSGVTDTPFRRLARRFGATMVVTEMVASERYAAGHHEELRKSDEDTPGAPYVMQLAGCSPPWMREAAIRVLPGSDVDSAVVPSARTPSHCSHTVVAPRSSMTSHPGSPSWNSRS